MSGWLYLIRNRDLYKIGITKNFDNRMRQLKPDKVIAKIYTRDFIKKLVLNINENFTNINNYNNIIGDSVIPVAGARVE